MNTVKYKKPTAEEFRKFVRAKMGNLTQVANTLHVSRAAVSRWVSEDAEFKEIVADERMQLFDESLQTARVVALGIPAYETVLDPDGNPVLDKDGKEVKRMSGWIERPDSQMLRYFMSTLGRREGFGEDIDLTETVKNGVNITAWIRKENEGK